MRGVEVHPHTTSTTDGGCRKPPLCAAWVQGLSDEPMDREAGRRHFTVSTQAVLSIIRGDRKLGPKMKETPV